MTAQLETYLRVKIAMIGTQGAMINAMDMPIGNQNLKKLTRKEESTIGWLAFAQKLHETLTN